MTKEYDEITAFHYAAYRPSLHRQILKECIEEDAEYNIGLDVGCGTGQSSIALTHYCDKVIGIEPSHEMLEKSMNHPAVEYKHYNGEYFDFSEDYFDIITFAGSLYYAKSQQILDEVIRVGKDASAIIVYDFDILLDDILDKLNVDRTLKQLSNYNHQVNFSGLDQLRIEVHKELNETISLDIEIGNIAHLLLSSKDNYILLGSSFGEVNLYDKILQKLQSIFESESTIVRARTYTTVYRIVK